MVKKSVMIGNGATLRCSLGSATSKLIVMNHGTQSIGKTQAVITDKIPMVNVMPFGSCNRPSPVGPVPCTPTITMNWLNADNNVKIKGIPALQKQCMVPCLLGGMIKIEKE